MTKSSSSFNLIGRARIVARFAHRGQVDKNNVDYFEHVETVAITSYELAPVELKAEAKMAGYLHDTVEDTPMGPEDLRTLGFPKSVVEAVLLLTHTHEHTHADYIRLIRDAEGRAGEIARVVKRCDMAHNADPRRALPGKGDWLRDRYERGLDILEGRVP